MLTLAEGITSPALIIAGEVDTKYVDLGRRLARAIRLARLEIIPGAGHAIHLERPEAFTASVAAFLATIEAA